MPTTEPRPSHAVSANLKPRPRPFLSGRWPAWWTAFIFMLVGLGLTATTALAADVAPPREPFPTPLSEYAPSADRPLWDVLVDRVRQDPFNLIGTLLFLGAIVHTFFAARIRALAHDIEHQHADRMRRAREEAEAAGRPFKDEVSFRAVVLEFFGEVEAVFGLWVLPLAIGIVVSRDTETAKYYLNHSVNYTEPMFVVVIMTMAATRPVMKLAEQAMAQVARLGGSTPGAWWFSILLLGPVLGSFITEPAAMTISALLLAGKFYELKPSNRLKYATLGLLFVNISVGGTLTHFAAPPVLMVQQAWGWDLPFMAGHYGWKAVLGIIISNILYYAAFRREFSAMRGHAGAALPEARSGTDAQQPDFPVPVWVTVAHLLFIAWTVANAHEPVLFVGGFLFFLAFVTATLHHQTDVRLKPALLVGFFLAGLVVHGPMQQWWIEPVLTRLDALPLMLGATILTAFNDNAAITYLATLVPNFTDELKYAVVAGAVTGGGLTVIANAPNPAGQSILQRFFEEGVNPAKLALGALVPTVILGVMFMALPF